MAGSQFPAAPFPALPSGNNPYIGAAAGAAGAASSVYNSLQNRIAAAAQQHDALKQQQATLQRQKDNDYQAGLQRAFENDNQLRAQGGVPAQVYASGNPAPSRPTLMTPEANPAANNDWATVTDPQGQSWKVPNASQKEEAGLNDTNSFVPTGQLGDMLEKAGRKKGARIKNTDSHSILQALNESQMDEPYDIDTSGKFQDSDGKPAAVMIGRKTGNVKILNLSGSGSQAEGGKPGAKPPAQPVAAQPASAFSFVLPDKTKADKPARTRIDTTNFSQPLSINEDTNEITPLKLPPGVRRTMSPAQEAANARRADAKSETEEKNQQAVRDRGQVAINALQTKEEEQHQLRGAYGKALAQPSKDANGQKVTVIDPLSRQEEFLTPARRADYENRYNKATALRDNYRAQSVKLIKRYGGDVVGPEVYPSDTPTPPPPPNPKTPAPTTPPQVSPPAQQQVQPIAAQGTPAAPSSYIVGRTYRGLKYLGGNPNSQASWSQ